MASDGADMGGAAVDTNETGVAGPQPDIAMGLMCLFQPVVEQIDSSVHGVQESQDALFAQIEALQAELNKFQGLPDAPEALERYTQKLSVARKSLNNINTLLIGVQDRVVKLHTNVTKAAKKRQAELQ